MSTLLAVAVAVTGLALLRLYKAKFPAPYGGSRCYSKRDRLLTPAERSFYAVLEQAVGDRFRIFPKVRVTDVLEVADGIKKRARRAAFNRVSAKQFDFLLCDPRDLSVIAAMELDAKAHQRRKRKERDAIHVHACRDAGLPLFRVPAMAVYSAQELRGMLLSALGDRMPASPPLLSPAIDELLRARRAAPETPEVTVEHPAMPDTPRCPECAAPMERRTAKAGSRAGQEFWSCSHFPHCCGRLMPQAAPAAQEFS